MANNEHVELARKGAEAIKIWRKNNPNTLLDLKGANLEGVNLSKLNLSMADLSGALLSGADFSSTVLKEANLEKSNLIQVNFSGADLSKAKIRRANLYKANLSNSNLHDTDLRDTQFIAAKLMNSNLSGANLRGANLRNANIFKANISTANLSWSNFREADLSRANLSMANLCGANLRGATLKLTKLGDAQLSVTILADIDLSETLGLQMTQHLGPSSLGIDTLMKSKGYIPEVFLRGCGLSDWEIQVARLYDQNLTANDISNILVENIMSARTDGPLFIGGTFISYSQKDSAFVEKLYHQLQYSGIRCWLDKHDLLAGKLEKQIFTSIRIQDIILLVLSENSIDSDWVEAELEAARQKEIDENRDVLCPIALDDTWKKKIKNNVLWRQVAQNNILDFSFSKTESFDSQFKKLIKGMKINYSVKR